MTVTEYAGSVDAPAAGDPLDLIAATLANEAPAPRARVTPWEFQYITAAVVLDAVAAFAAGVAAYIAWPGSDALPTLYFALTVAMPAIWLTSLGLADSYERSRLAVGPEEFNRIGLAGLGLVAAVALFAWTTQTDIPRGFVAVALFGAMAGSSLARFGLRKYLHRQRRQGRQRRQRVQGC